MKSRTLISVSAFLFAVLAFQVRPTAQEQLAGQQSVRYSVIDLGTLGGTFSVANGVNNREWVTGAANLPGDIALHALAWQLGQKIDLGTLGGPNSAGQAINQKGQIVGNAENSILDPMGEDFCFFGTHLICLPFIWQNGIMSPLSTLGGNNGIALGVNARGQVVGQAENSTLDSTCPAPKFQVQAVIWEKDMVQELFPAAGDIDGFAGGINDAGQVVGGSGNCFLTLHALLWQRGMVTDLGNLGGALFSQASAINHRGQVVGASDLSGDTNFFAGPFSNFHGFLWKNGTIRDLGTLAGDVTSFATGINNKGQVVGVGFFGNGQSRAFLWQNGVMTDLNALVPGPPFSPLYLVQANGVNERGEIVGIGLSRTGAQHAFLAVPCDHDDSSNSGCDKNVTVAQAGPPAFDVSHSPNTPRNPPFRTRLGRVLPRGNPRFDGHHIPILDTGSQN